MDKKTKGRILVVDDETLACEMLAKFMDREGYAVTPAFDGEEGVRVAKETRPDAILLDIRMPGMDGMEVLQHIRGFDQEVVIVMTTAVDDLGTALEAIRRGANDFLRKPVVLYEVLHAIESGIEKRDLRRDNRAYQHQLEEKVAAQTRELRQINTFLKRTNIAIFHALSAAIEGKDTSAKEHGARVVQMSQRLGRALGLSGEAMETLEVGALLHDISRIGINPAHSEFHCHLGEEACNKLHEHPQLGWETIHNGKAKTNGSSPEETAVARGMVSGGASMDLIASIVMIADAFDALTADRPHAKGLSVEKALQVLEEHKGTQFDAKLVEAFIREKPFIGSQ